MQSPCLGLIYVSLFSVCSIGTEISLGLPCVTLSKILVKFRVLRASKNANPFPVSKNLEFSSDSLAGNGFSFEGFLAMHMRPTISNPVMHLEIFFPKFSEIQQMRKWSKVITNFQYNHHVYILYYCFLMQCLQIRTSS